MTDKEKLEAVREEVHRLVDVRGYDREMANDLFTFMDSLPNEPVSEDLKEFEVEYIEREKDNIVCVYDRYAGLVDGAKWQKEQMMAKAVEGGCFSYKNGFVHISCDIDEHLTDIKIGDKVKLIIVKEE